MAVAAAALVPATTLAVVSHANGGDNDDYDSRTAFVEPSAAQLAAVEALE